MSVLTKAFDGPYWDNGILDRERHGPLIANIDQTARRSGLGRGISAVWEPLPPDTTALERRWLQGIVRNENTPNLQYTGSMAKTVAKFQSFTGALIRNFIDARILTVDEIAELALERDGDDRQVKATVLFVPDMTIPGETQAKSDRVRQAVIGVVRRRIIERMPTVIFQMQTTAQPWGVAMHDQLNAFLKGGTL